MKYKIDVVRIRENSITLTIRISIQGHIPGGGRKAQTGEI